LTVYNVTSHALPSRPGLEVKIIFAEGAPIKWESGLSKVRHLRRRLEKYEWSRFTQVLMAIPRSVRVRDGLEGLGGTRWTFVGAGRFGEEKYWRESTDRIVARIREWAQREYMAAGWTKDEVEMLIERIEFEV
jgi:hypothetical protein